MTITNQNVKIYRGDTETLTVTLTNTANGLPFTVAPGVELRYRIAPSAHAPEEESLVVKNYSDGGITVDDGVVSIPLNSTDTDLEPFLYYHEMKVIDGQLDDVSTAFTGNVVIKRTLSLANYALEADDAVAGAPALEQPTVDLPT